MAPSVDCAAYTDAMKAIFIEKEIQDLTWPDNPLYAIIPKYEEFGGEYSVIPVKYGRPSGRSANFPTAQANAKGTSRNKFKITVEDLADDFGVATWSDKVVEASRSDPFAFARAEREEIDGILGKLAETVEWTLLGDGSGDLGASSTFVLKVCTMANAADVEKIEPGDKIVAALNTASDPRDAGKAVEVDSVDPDAGTITATTNWNTIVGITDGDHLFFEGDYEAANDKNKIAGLEGWFPEVPPAAGDDWYGVDRSKHVTRLAGSRLDISGYPMLIEGLKEAQLVSAKRGKAADVCMLSYNKYDEVLDDLMGKVEYTKIPARSVKGPVADISFKAALINGPKGQTAIMPNRFMSDSVGWMIRLDACALWSMRTCPHIMDKDGLTFRAMANDPGYEVRALYYAQFVVKRPLNFVRLKLV